MRVCPICRCRDNPLWRSSRFELNADLMDWPDFKTEYPVIALNLVGLANHLPVDFSRYYPETVVFRRGTGGCKVYRVPKEDFKVPRERKNHKVCGCVERKGEK